MKNWGAGGSGGLGWPQIPPGLAAIASHPVLGERPEARCVLRRLPDIAPFPSAVSSSKCSPDLIFFFILFWLYHRLLMRRRGVQLVLVFGGESWAAQELPWGLCILGCLLLESEFVSFVFYFRCS